MCRQGSAKLEKAEILQMTVDHLKVLQATGGKGTTTKRTQTAAEAALPPTVQKNEAKTSPTPGLISLESYPMRDKQPPGGSHMV